MEWKIVYGDGSTFSSEDGTPEEAPGLNVQCIIQANPDVGRMISSKSDFYIKVGDMWTGADLFGVLDQFIAQGLLKAGRTLTNAEYQKIWDQAVNDPDFPRKSANAVDDVERIPR